MTARDRIARQLDVDPRDPWALAVKVVSCGLVVPNPRAYVVCRRLEELSTGSGESSSVAASDLPAPSCLSYGAF